MDRFNLERFVSAQEGVYASVLRELHSGRKQSHWMWFIFPQLAGLGHSSTARFYALCNLAEARAYLDHPLLGPRLLECTRAVVTVEGCTAEDIFGHVDALKLHSSLTLFGRASEPDPLFVQALDKYYGGGEDQQTLQLLGLARTRH